MSKSDTKAQVDKRRQIVWEPLDALVPYANNSRTHPEEQVAQIAALIREYGWTQPIVADSDGTILAGHGRLAAAYKLRCDRVPVLRVEGWSEAKARAYVIADNKVASNSTWDREILRLELEFLNEESFEMQLLGFATDELSAIMGLDDQEDADEPDEPGEEFYEIIVGCVSENQQIELLDDFESRGWKCRALI